MSIIAGLADHMLEMEMLLAAITLFTYDWMLTLAEEIKYIWRAKPSVVRTIFLLNRYIVWADLIFAAYGWSGYARWFTETSCKVFLTADNFILLAFFASLHYIIALRTWNLWGRGTRIGYFIWGSFLASIVATFALLGKSMAITQTKPVPPVFLCLGPLPSFNWTIWLPNLIFECLIFFATAWRALKHARSSVLENKILSIFYRDYFLYFLFITLNSLVNVFFMVGARPTQVLVYKYFSAAICQVAIAHLILGPMKESSRVTLFQYQPSASLFPRSNATDQLKQQLQPTYDWRWKPLPSISISLDIESPKSEFYPKAF